jgi:putative phage-type endonuclease
MTSAMEQRTDDWLEWRRQRITASDVAAICGLDQYRSQYQVWLDKIGMGKPVPINEDMQRGIDNEGIALDMFNSRLELQFKPAIFQSEKYPWLGASIDGFYENFGRKIICEIKCPRLCGHEYAKQRMIPDKYIYQMQSQLLVTGANLCFFCSYHEEDLVVVDIKPDQAIQEHIIRETKKFWYENVIGFTAPEMRSGDYIERDDDDFQRLTILLR